MRGIKDSVRMDLEGILGISVLLVWNNGTRRRDTILRDSWNVSTYSAGNNSRSADIVRPNFENARPISHYDRPR